MLRAVLIGCGKMARGWLEALSQPELANRVKLVGLVDIDPLAADRLRDEVGLRDVVTGSNLNAILTATKPDLLFDVVIPAARRDVVATGLANGCHVLSEKPMAVSLYEGRELVRLAKEAKRTHAVVQNRRFVSGVRRIRRMVESGALGELNALHVDFFIGAHFGGFREQMHNILLVDMAIHTFDAARFMSGRDADAVYCHQSNPPGSWYDHGAVANAIFELSGGVLFTYRGSWVAEGANTSWDSSWRIIGSRGTLLWDGGDGFEARIMQPGKSLVWPTAAIEVPPPADIMQTREHASVIADFVDAIESGRTPETDSTDNIKSLAMVFAAVESSERRARVEIAN